MKKLLLIIFIFGVYINCFSQDQHLIDSLQAQLRQLQAEKAELRKNTPSIRDSSIAKILINLCTAYQRNNPDKTMDYAKQVLTLSEQISWKKGISAAHNSIGIVYKGQGNYPEALKNHFAALKIREEIGDKKGMAGSYNNIGNIYLSQGNYPEALKQYFSALKINEEIHNKSWALINYNNIGLIYQKQENYSETLKNYFAALKIGEEIGDKNGIAYSYNNIGCVYMEQGKYPEALKNFFAALKTDEELGNKDGIANVYGNIGIVYKEQGNYPEALKHDFAALKIFEEIGNKKGIVANYINIGLVYSKKNRAKEAKIWLQKGLDLSKEIGAKETIKNAYSNLAKADSTLGNYKGAFENHKLYIIYKDSLLNEENIKKQTQTEMQYEFDKKESLAKAEQEKKDTIVAAEQKRQRSILTFVSCFLVLVALLAVVIFRSLRINQQKNKIISAQKHLVEEKQKEILDSINYAERIQRSLLASKDLLNQNFGSEENYFVLFKPKDIVSGDFYWASVLQNNHFALITADSTGHGVPGAIMSILNIACINEAVKEGYTSPSDILNRTRKEIISVLKRDGSAEGGKDGMDCSLISFDFKNSKMTYAAANNPLWFLRKNELLEFVPDKMPVGKHDKDRISFNQHTIELQKGDIIYTLTDGLPDQFGGPKGKKFMYKKLKDLLISISQLSMAEQKEQIVKVLNDWMGDNEQVDDITVIGVKI